MHNRVKHEKNQNESLTRFVCQEQIEMSAFAAEEEDRFSQ